MPILPGKLYLMPLRRGKDDASYDVLKRNPLHRRSQGQVGLRKLGSSFPSRRAGREGNLRNEKMGKKYSRILSRQPGRHLLGDHPSPRRPQLDRLGPYEGTGAGAVCERRKRPARAIIFTGAGERVFHRRGRRHRDDAVPPHGSPGLLGPDSEALQPHGGLPAHPGGGDQRPLFRRRV